MKIGIVGGTFDPIHNGHLMLGRYARELFLLDEIWFMPNGTPPHKSKSSICTGTEHRVEMVRRAIASEKDFKLQLYETEHPGVHYSYLTMEHFQRCYPEHEFYFIVGADSLFDIDKWKCPDRLLKTCILLAAYRDGKSKSEMEEKIEYLKEKYDADIRLLETPDVDIASKEIRLQSQAGMSLEGKVPKTVFDYICEKHLYPFDLSEMRNKVKAQQSEERFEHVVGVMYTAAALAMRYGADMKKALVAGLLHDCAKAYPPETKLELCEKYGICVSSIERENPELLHAPLGACVAKEEYGINDEEILHSIACHTTGCPNMTLLDKIIYIADYIEPNRTKASDLEEIRKMAFEDLDACLRKVLHATLTYLKSGQKVIDPLTEETYHFYQ